jgi:nitrous oxide reductase
MLGRKPRRIDILTGISGVPFARAAKQKVMVSVDEQDVPVIGRVALIENKLASGRTKHLLDVEVLQKYGRRAESARKKRPTVTRRKTPSRA